ncbi:30S ribosomal protein S17 [Candidatus Synchoanobacter obligatus]|uniref:Small ribosomal subunit protein uS17 n=1 Tax=Candidatus Synchoanobacter obligatus TaxID=2919597 RepID=A0ABT1L5Q1_9GAMM|nr:30S ribosomal protein S17 [Candidatus Synchoanobacter obligatus]MCP8352495.1 30S ribosomal protein S17 [Candidatus Synchoanobacter obligatus]
MSSRQKKLTGVVSSNKMDKTAVVVVTRKVKHEVVGKYYNRSQKLKVHDAENVLQIGDTVEIGEVKPISKDKSWSLIKVISHAAGVSS